MNLDRYSLLLLGCADAKQQNCCELWPRREQCTVLAWAQPSSQLQGGFQSFSRVFSTVGSALQCGSRIASRLPKQATSYGQDASTSTAQRAPTLRSARKADREANKPPARFLSSVRFNGLITPLLIQVSMFPQPPLWLTSVRSQRPRTALCG